MKYSLERIADPSVMPITLATLKKNIHLHPTVGTEQDDVLNMYIEAAADEVEQHLRRSLITQDWRIKIDGAPEYIYLLRPPVQEVIEIVATVEDLDGNQTDEVVSDYEINTDDSPAVLKPEWPDNTVSVSVEYRAGYGDEPTDVPASIRQAITLFASHMDDARTGEIEIPVAVYLLIKSRRMYAKSPI